MQKVEKMWRLCRAQNRFQICRISINVFLCNVFCMYLPKNAKTTSFENLMLTVILRSNNINRQIVIGGKMVKKDKIEKFWCFQKCVCASYFEPISINGFYFFCTCTNIIILYFYWIQNPEDLNMKLSLLHFWLILVAIKNALEIAIIIRHW